MLDKPARESYVRNGVRVKITRSGNGSVCETTCHCLGLDGKTHSNPWCPNRERQRAQAA